MASSKETFWNTYNPIGYARKKRQEAAAERAARKQRQEAAAKRAAERAAALQALPGQIAQAEQNASVLAQANAYRYEDVRKQRQEAAAKRAAERAADMQRRQRMNGSRQAFNEKQDIEAKEKEMIEILGSASLGQVATQKRIVQIAQHNPAAYQKLLQLAKEVDAYHSKNDSFWKSWSGIGDFIGAAGDNASIARRILRSTNENPYTLTRNLPQYNSPVQQVARKNISQFNKKTFENLDTQDPAQLLDVMRSIKQAYEYEIQNIVALPDGSQRLYEEAVKRANDYLLAWGRAKSSLSKMAADAHKYLNFLKLYKTNPLDPLSAEDAASIDGMISSLAASAKEQEAAKIRAGALGGTK